jgi:hypothetical protein
LILASAVARFALSAFTTLKAFEKHLESPQGEHASATRIKHNDPITVG